MTKYLFHVMENLSSFLKIKKSENHSYNKLENTTHTIDTKLIEYKKAPPKHKPNLHLRKNINIIENNQDKKSMAKSEIPDNHKSSVKKK